MKRLTEALLCVFPLEMRCFHVCSAMVHTLAMPVLVIFPNMTLLLFVFSYRKQLALLTEIGSFYILTLSTQASLFLFPHLRKAVVDNQVMLNASNLLHCLSN